MREKALKVGAFLPAKIMAKNVIEEHTKCERDPIACKASKVYMDGYISLYKKYHMQRRADNMQRQLEEEVEYISEENTIREASLEGGEEGSSLSEEIELTIELIG